MNFVYPRDVYNKRGNLTKFEDRLMIGAAGTTATKKNDNKRGNRLGLGATPLR